MTGGLSHDGYVREVVFQRGVVDVWQVSVSLGGAIALGAIEERPFSGLPGNPVAAAIGFELFVRPALLKLAGRKTVQRPEVEATLEDPCQNDSGRETYVRVQAWTDGSGWRARLTGKQSENIVTSVSGANAFGVVPQGQAQLQAGETIRLMLLEPLEGW